MTRTTTQRGMLNGFLVNFAFNLVGTGLSSLATLLVVRYLDPGAWGLAAAVLGVGQLTGSVLSFGSQTEHVRRYARLNQDQALRAAVPDSAVRVGIALLLVVAGLLVCLWSPISGVAVICAAGTFTSLGTTNYFISVRRFQAAGGLLVLEKALGFSAIVVVSVAGATTSFTLPLTFGLAGVGVGIVAAVIQSVSARSRIRMLRWSDVARHWRGTAFFGLASLAPSLLLVDSTIVATFSDVTQAGYFSVGSKLVAPLSIATTSIVSAVLPYMSATPRGHLPKLRRRSGVPAIGALVIAVVALLCSAGWWVPVLFGNDYANSVWPVRFYLLNIMIVVVTRLFSTILQAWGDERAVAALVLSQVAVALVGIAVGAAIGGALWASVSVLTTNIVLSLALALRVARLKRSVNAAEAARC